VTFTAGDSIDYATVTGTASIAVAKSAVLGIAENAVVAHNTAVPVLVANMFGSINYADFLIANAATTATQGSAAGLYPITITWSANPGALGNYITTSESGVLEIYSDASKVVPLLSRSVTYQGGGGYLVLTVYGPNFPSNAVVLWNGQARQTTWVSSTELDVKLQPADLATEQTAQVTVANPAPNASIRAALPAQVMAFLPVAQVTAASLSAKADGSGNHTLTVTGLDMLPDSVVQWGGTALATAWVGPRALKAAVPAKQYATPAPLVVVNPAGSSAPFTAP
jgi:hypothetical protein